LLALKLALSLYN